MRAYTLNSLLGLHGEYCAAVLDGYMPRWGLNERVDPQPCTAGFFCWLAERELAAGERSEVPMGGGASSTGLKAGVSAPVM